MASITFHQSDGSKFQCELVAATITFGKGDDNDIVLNDAAVSTRHGQVSFQEGKFLLTDLGSTNGIMVNGEKITDHELSHGDAIKIGSLNASFDLGLDSPARGGKISKKDTTLMEVKDVETGHGEEEEDAPIPHPPPTPDPEAAAPPPPPPAHIQNIQAGAKKTIPEGEPIGFYLFIMACSLLATIFIALATRHYIETGGNFITDSYEKIRYIQGAAKE